MGEFKPVREGWVTVFQSSTDYEADMVRDRLDSAGIPAAVFTQRDHALSLTIGKLALVYVLVPEDYKNQAEAVLEELPLSETELNSAVDASEQMPGDEDPGREQLLDSGIERIRFTKPEDPPDEETA